MSEKIDINATLEDMVIAHQSREIFFLKKKLDQAKLLLHEMQDLSKHLVPTSPEKDTDQADGLDEE